MKLDHEIKVADVIQAIGFLLLCAVIWGSTKMEIAYLRRDVDADQRNIVKLTEGFSELAKSQAVLTAIVNDGKEVAMAHRRTQSPKDSEN